ncbi:MAG: hypothetical protein AAGJ81_11990 [Verrucomicrobiota bacterium]
MVCSFVKSCIRSPALAFAALFLTAFLNGEEWSLRQWTSVDGREMQARLIEIRDDGQVTIERQDGFRFTLDRSRFSPADVAYIEKQEAIGRSKEIDWKMPSNSPFYVIKSVRKTKVDGYIRTEEGWEHGINAIEVIVEYEGERISVKGSIAAYFFDRDDQLIRHFKEASRIEVSNEVYEDPPKSFEPGERYNVYFPISKFLEGRDWDTVLVVFSGPDGISAEMDPRRSFEDFAFSEKERLFPDWDPSLLVKDDTETIAPTTELELEIRRVRRSDWPLSLLFNGDWRRGGDCIESEVRVRGGLPSKTPEVRLYLFDRENQLVGQRNKPSMAAIGGQEYVQVPKISEERDWYPVVFALDEDLERLDWRSAVVVFSIGKQSVAEIYSRSGAELEDVSFPEKKRLGF